MTRSVAKSAISKGYPLADQAINPMFEVLERSIRPLTLNLKVLEVAYELYLQAPQSYCPTISLKEVSIRTGLGMLECRNAIVEANRLGRFPDCALES